MAVLKGVGKWLSRRLAIIISAKILRKGVFRAFRNPVGSLLNPIAFHGGVVYSIAIILSFITIILISRGVPLAYNNKGLRVFGLGQIMGKNFAVKIWAFFL